MKRRLNILLEELRRLKEEGVAVVAVSDDALGRLRERVGALAPATTGGREDQDVRSAEILSRFEPAGAGRLPDFNPDSGPVAKVKVSRTPAGPKLPAPPAVVLPAGDKQSRWEALRKQVLECPTCNEQVPAGGKVVFGVGNLDADIFFIGEAPGTEEEAAGEPFVGAPGETLTKMVGAMGLKREQVYITNVMNWRPEPPSGIGSRQPRPDEMEFCLPYLLAQIEIVRPKVLVALGNTVVNGLFGADPKRKLKDVRGQWRDFRGTPTIITYHPAYLVRSASMAVKRTVWEDLLEVMERVGLEITEKQRNYFRK